MDEIELYAPVKDHPKYYVSRRGEVFSMKTKRHLTPDIHNGYARVNIDGKKYYISNLVAEAFIKQEPGHTKVVHIDGDPLNNSVSNLKWMSPFYARRECRGHTRH